MLLTNFNVFPPERQNHARELIREISLPEWDGIIIISGDGLLHEVCIVLQLSLWGEVAAMLLVFFSMASLFTCCR